MLKPKNRSKTSAQSLFLIFIRRDFLADAGTRKIRHGGWNWKNSNSWHSKCQALKAQKFSGKNWCYLTRILESKIANELYTRVNFNCVLLKLSSSFYEQVYNWVARFGLYIKVNKNWIEIARLKWEKRDNVVAKMVQNN